MNIANEINNLKGLVAAAFKAGKTANERIDALPLPMVFKGTLGTGGTISTLPTASSSNEGYVYIVITDGTYAGTSAKAGDTFVSDGSAWVLVPSADEPSPIDDSVTSTVLTWSSSKINKDLKIKSFTYTGTGTNANHITTPTNIQYIANIVGESSTYKMFLNSMLDVNNISAGYTAVQVQVGVSTTLASGGASYNASTNDLLLSSGQPQRAFNELDVVYTVYYI